MAVATSTALIGMTAVGAAGAYTSSSAANATANAQSEAQIENANRKYRLESGVSNQQMEEQQGLAMEKMTEISREFLKVKSTAEAQQAESGVAGVSAERIKAVTSTKESEAKGKVAKEINTNVVNIAQGMLASKIETEGIIADAKARMNPKNVMFDTIMGGIQGGIQGYSMSKSMLGGLESKSIADTSQGYSWNQYNSTIRV